jgi:hypothetical protein
MEDIDFLISLLNNHRQTKKTSIRGMNTGNCISTDTPEDDCVTCEKVILPMLKTNKPVITKINSKTSSISSQPTISMGFYNPVKKYLKPFKIKKL